MCASPIAIEQLKGKQQGHRSCDDTQALKKQTEQRPLPQIKIHEANPQIRVKAPKWANDMQLWIISYNYLTE